MASSHTTRQLQLRYIMIQYSFSPVLVLFPFPKPFPVTIQTKQFPCVVHLVPLHLSFSPFQNAQILSCHQSNCSQKPDIKEPVYKLSVLFDTQLIFPCAPPMRFLCGFPFKSIPKPEYVGEERLLVHSILSLDRRREGLLFNRIRHLGKTFDRGSRRLRNLENQRKNGGSTEYKEYKEPER